MLVKANKGQVSYGEAVGIILLDTFTPFIPGDVGNATTYSFPVRYQRVEGFTFNRLLKRDPALIEPVIEAGRSLVREGVKAVTGDCGYMALYQDILLKELQVPVFMSSLMQIPFISSMLQKEEKIGIICSNSLFFNEELLKNIHIPPHVSLSIHGMEGRMNFTNAAHQENGMLDPKLVEAEVVAVAEEMVHNDPNIKAILLECSSLPPYANSVQQAVRLPVFDYITMIDYVHSALIKNKYYGYL